MFKSKARKKQDQEWELSLDINNATNRLCEVSKMVAPMRLDQGDIEDAAYYVTIAKDLDASPRNWARYQRLVKSFEGNSLLTLLNGDYIGGYRDV